MANRTVKVVLEGQVTGFQGAMRTAQKSAKDFGDQFTNAGKRAGAFWNENRADIDRTANSLMVAGGAGVAALALMTRQAMSWESAWAGVTKTVDGTTEEMASLQAGLREMATELPATHEEIAAVAEAAGQLGIQTPNILSFTRTMIDLGQTTNLSAEEAATGLARFSNIMGTNQTDADRLGSTIVGLGNNFATTEAEILSLSMRLAGAGRQVGLSEAEVMGLATAMSSLGIDAEAGGSAMSLTMKRIAKEVELGGEKLDMFASVAGMSSAEFTTAWGENAAGALTTFIAGLADTEHMGMSAGLVMDELGIKGLRETDALIRMSGAHGLVNDAIRLGTEAYRDNVALADEAAQRYATTESQMKVAANSIKDAGIEVGQYMLPILADLSNGVADLAGWFAGLPDPVQKTIVAVGGFGSVTALAVGGALKLAGSIGDTVGSVKRLSENIPALNGRLGTISKVAGIAAISIGAVVAAATYKGGDSAQGLQEIEDGLYRLAAGGTAAETAFKGSDGGGFFRGASMDLKELVDVLSDDSGWTKFDRGSADALTGLNNFVSLGLYDARAEWQIQRDELVAYGERLAALATVDLPTAQSAFKQLATEAGGSAEAQRNLLDLMPDLRDSLIGIARDSGLATDDATLLKLAMGDLGPATEQVTKAALDAQVEVDALGQAFDDQAEAAAAAWEALNAWVGGAVGAERARMSYEAAIDGVTEALEKNGKSLDITTEKGRANRGALLDIVDAGMSLIDSERAMGASEEELQQIMQDTRDALIKGADQMGMTGDEAIAYADDLGLIPENVDTEVLLAIERAQANKEQLKKEISIAGMSLSDWMIDADGEYALDEANGVKYRIDRTTGEIKIEGKDKNALSEARDIVDRINNRSASVPIDANVTRQAETSLHNFRNAIGRPVSVPVNIAIAAHQTSINNAARSAANSIKNIWRADGGRAGTGSGLPAFAGGGRLPSTGLGRDQILGVNPMGQPTAWVDDLEWVVNRKSSDKYDSALNAINQDAPGVQHLAAYGNGGVAQSYPAAVAQGGGGQAFDYDKLAAALNRSQGATGTQVTIHQTNHNPTKVPTVVQTQQALADVGALGVLGNV